MQKTEEGDGALNTPGQKKVPSDLLPRLKVMLGPLILHSEWQLVCLTAAFGAGSALYIAGPLPLIPLSWALVAGVLAAGMMFVPGIRHRMMFRGLAFCLLGTAAAAVRISGGTAPIVQADTYVHMDAVVERVEVRPEKPTRLLLAPTMVGKSWVRIPPHVRLIVRTGMPDLLTPGDRVRLSALLSRPPGPVVPGGYDFARSAYFSGIGAVGYATSPIERISPVGPMAGWGLKENLESLRLKVANRITANIPGQAGALAAALSVGFRNTLSEDTSQTLRRTGLSHLLAISGLHMGLVTAAAFLVLEYLFAAISPVALRVRPKKLAAAGAWAVALAYLLLSGGAVSTVRAFAMVSVALLAILMDRRVLSLRSVALAALLILILWPEAVLGIGFQMSFAATAVLVAFYEYASGVGWMRPLPQSGGIPDRVWRFLKATFMTTLVAQAAVAPFALYHFQSMSLIGVVANLVVIPFVSIGVMPLILLNLLLMLVGMDRYVAPLLDVSLSAILDVAHYLSSLPMTMLRVGAPDQLFLPLVATALIGVLVVRGRWLGLPVGGILLTASLLLPGRSADMMIDNEGRVVAVPDAEGNRLMVSGGRRDSFRDVRWQQYWGLDPLKPDGKLPRMCDAAGCRTSIQGYSVSLVRQPEAVRPACGAGDIVILPWRWRRYCRGALAIISAEDINRRGPAALYWRAGRGEIFSPKVVWSNPPGDRPWQPKRRYLSASSTKKVK